MPIVGSDDALIVVDVQNDFCPGGALAVGNGDLVVPIINLLSPMFAHRVFTRDWHPENHCSFSESPRFVDGSWPVHCLANTPGADFHPDLDVPPDAVIVSKGTEPDFEAYSGFQGTDLADLLRQNDVVRLFVCGLATDYCVKHTALDGLRQGFEVVVMTDACRAVDVPPGTGDSAVREMEAAGAKLSQSAEISR